MRILITGASGFVGGHLVQALRHRSENQLLGLSRSSEQGAIPLRTCDLCDAGAVLAVLREFQPEQIYHLAGYAAAGRSFQEPEAAWEGNLTATRRLYDAVVRWGGRPRILYVGSGLVYGDIDRPHTILTEESLLRPNSPYAASKAAADLTSFQLTCQPGLDIVRARPFNHIGPGQSSEYAVASFARQLAVIARGKQPAVLETGNLQPRRDLSDVRDIVSAYLLLMEKGARGAVYNIASGQTWSMQSILERLRSLAGVQIEVRQRSDLVRATDLTVPHVDTTALRQATGWAPAYPLDQTLADTLDYWRART